MASPARLTLPRIYPIIDSEYVRLDRMAAVAQELLSAGARITQLRAKDVAPRSVLEAARAISAISARHGAPFMVNDRLDIALLSGAQGVHIGQEDIPLLDARRVLGAGMAIGFSTHDADEAIEAEKNGADYISFGPVFPTRTKRDAQTPRGIGMLKEVRKAVRVPIVAIGGITEDNMEEVFSAGADSVAMISDILLSGDMRRKMASVTRKASGLKG